MIFKVIITNFMGFNSICLLTSATSYSKLFASKYGSLEVLHDSDPLTFDVLRDGFDEWF